MRLTGYWLMASEAWEQKGAVHLWMITGTHCSCQNMMQNSLRLCR